MRRSPRRYPRAVGAEAVEEAVVVAAAAAVVVVVVVAAIAARAVHCGVGSS